MKGNRLPTLPQVLRDAITSRTTVMVTGWYRDPQRTIEVVSATAVWYHTGMPPVPIRWVLIRDPLNKFRPQAVLSTALRLSPTHIVMAFVQRWQGEVTFQEVRTHLGVETQRQWAELAIARTTPTLLGLFSVVIVCGCSVGAADGYSSAGSLVRQVDPHLCRRPGSGPGPLVATYAFFTVPERLRPRTNPTPTFRVLD